MAKKEPQTTKQPRRRPPAATPEARNNQLIGYAIDLAERQLLEGTASSQVISHFLKLATEQTKLQTAMLEKQTELLEAKTEAIKASARNEELYENALKAMSSYQGKPEVFDND